MLKSNTVGSVRMGSLVSYISTFFPGWHLDPDVSLGIGVAYALALGYFFLRARRNYRSLPELAACATQPEPPDCMVVIPARNEGDMIARAVRSLPPDSVLVIDDQSEDNTAAEAEAAGAGVYKLAKLPERALGKPYACSVGAKAVTTKWILFADADTWYEPGVLESLIQAAEADNLSFLSLHPVMECQGVAEHILTPYCQALYFAAVNPQTCPEGAFDGHCVLVRREAYEFIGGHASNSSFLVDDLKLALLAQRHRMKLGLVRTSRLAHARFHRGWSGMWEGLARNGFKLSLLPVSIWLVTLLLMMVAALWLPMVVLEFVMSWTALAAVLLVLPILLLLSWYRNPMQALLAPLAFYAMLPMAGHALYCVIASHRVSWKGRGVS